MFPAISEPLALSGQVIAGVIIDAGLKGALVLALAAVGAAAARRSSAAVRHRIWFLGLLGALLTPLLSVAMPRWNIPILPAQAPPAISAVDPVASADLAPQAPALTGVSQYSEETQSTPNFAQPLMPEPAPTRALSEPAVDAPLPKPPAEAEAIPITVAFVSALLPLTWAVGAILLFAPLALGIVANRRLIRRAKRIADDSWTELAAKLASKIGLARSVPAYETEAKTVPMVAGVVAPVLILPDDWRSWPDERRRCVILHELAHIKRTDVLVQILGRMAVAIHWFNPLAWHALRRLRVERELACDDCVIATGERASDYAGQLVQIARMYRPPRLALALAMSRSARVDDRVLALLDRARSHLPITRRSAGLLLAFFAVVAAFISAATLTSRPAAALQPEPSADQTATENSVDETKPAAVEHARGQVTDAAGKPVAEASVISALTTRYEHRWIKPAIIVDRTMSDANGNFEIALPDKSDRQRKFRTEFGSLEYRLVVLASKAGHVFDFREIEPTSTSNVVALQLDEDVIPIEGRVLDLEGRPIAGARLAVRGHSTPTSRELLDQWILAAAKNPNSISVEDEMRSLSDPKRPRIAYYPGGKSIFLYGIPIFADVVTGPDGRFVLRGAGSDRYLTLELEGSGIAKSKISVLTRPIEPFTEPNIDPRWRVHLCYGSRFDYSAEPSLPIVGVVRDLENQRPIPNARIVVSQYAGSSLMVNNGFLETRTDQEGRYRLEGLPISQDKERHRFEVLPAADALYFRTPVDVARVEADSLIVRDIELRRATWLTGRLVERGTQKPIEGLVSYYPELENPHAKEFANFSLSRESLSSDSYATDKEGRFRIPALPGRGVILATAKWSSEYEVAAGSAELGWRPGGTSEEKRYYHVYGPELANTVKAVESDRHGDFDAGPVELVPLDHQEARVTSADGAPLRGFRVVGRTPYSGVNHSETFESPVKIEADRVDVLGLAFDARRLMIFWQPERRVGKILVAESGKLKNVALEPFATVSGRALDSTGAPAIGVRVSANYSEEAFPPPRDNRVWGRRSYGIDRARTDKDGRFKLTSVIPGVAYQIYVDRNPVAVPTVAPAAEIDLGDVRTEAEPAKEDDTTKQISAGTPSTIEQSTKAGSSPMNASPSNPKEVVVRGRALGAEGKPLAGAEVAVVALNIDPKHRFRGDVLGETITDGGGRFELPLQPIQKTHSDIAVIVRAAGHGIVGRRLAAMGANPEVELQLPLEQPLTGRMIDIEGQPAAGLRIEFNTVVVTQAGDSGNKYFQIPRFDKTPKAWPAAISTDDRGAFSIANLAAGHGVFLSIAGNERFAPQEIAINTGISEKRGPNDRRYRPQVKNAKPGEVIAITLSPAQMFEGTVWLGKGDQRAANARITIGATQQETGGSSKWIEGTTDANGRFRLNPPPGVRFDIVAYPPDGSPYQARHLNELSWTPGGPSSRLEIRLSAGVLARGIVVDAETAKPLVGASIQYIPMPNNPNVTEGVVTGWQGIQTTNDAGAYEIAVLPGPGVLLVHASDDKYVLQETSLPQLTRGKSGGRRYYAHAIERIDPKAGAVFELPKIRLAAGVSMSGTIVDEAGKPIGNALMISRLKISPNSPTWRGSPEKVAGGKFTLNGLRAGEVYQVYFVDLKNRLGAVAAVNSRDPAPTITLRPCASAKARFLGTDGKPVRSGLQLLLNMVVTPGQPRYDTEAYRRGEIIADEDVVENCYGHPYPPPKTDADGVMTYPVLIPGAKYRFFRIGNVEGPRVHEFTAQSGLEHDLGDIQGRG